MKNVIKNAVSSIKHWWIYLVTGILLIAVSFLVVFTPFESYLSLAGIFSFLVLFNGLFTTYYSIANRKRSSGWGWYLAAGIFETIAGIALIYYPEISVALLPMFIGFWLLFRATQLIANSLELKNYGILDWGWFMTLGVLLSIMSFFMIFNPLFGVFSVISLAFVSFFTAGVSNIWLSLKLRRIKVQTLQVVDNVKASVRKSLKDLKTELNTILDSATEEKNRVKDKMDQLEASLSQ